MWPEFCGLGWRPGGWCSVACPWVWLESRQSHPGQGFKEAGEGRGTGGEPAPGLVGRVIHTASALDTHCYSGIKAALWAFITLSFSADHGKFMCNVISPGACLMHGGAKIVNTVPAAGGGHQRSPRLCVRIGQGLARHCHLAQHPPSPPIRPDSLTATQFTIKQLNGALSRDPFSGYMRQYTSEP